MGFWIPFNGPPELPRGSNKDWAITTPKADAYIGEGVARLAGRFQRHGNMLRGTVHGAVMKGGMGGDYECVRSVV